MKIEAILLSLVCRFLEVGLREKQLVQPQEITSTQHLHSCDCDCSCYCLSNPGIQVREIVLIALLSFAILYIWYLRRTKEEPPSLHASPRRKGGGIVVMPSRGQDNSLVQ